MLAEAAQILAKDTHAVTTSQPDKGEAYRTLMQDVAVAVREAGELARSAFGKPLKTWFKNKNSPVSEMDIAVDALLRERLGTIAPEAGWLSEETEDAPARLAATQVWIVDPIDGTRAFIAGTPDWTISVALVEAGRPVVAALYAPITEELFLAALGSGTIRNGSPVSTSAAACLAGIRIAGPKGCLDRLAAVAPPFAVVPRVHSLALRLARVADGTFDVAVAGHNSHDWDLAAADLLVHEAGGALTTTRGVKPAYNRPSTVHGLLFASGRARHRALIALLEERKLACGETPERPVA
jgi:myo-inositol-1(or 4)-monophosphatase